jgi:hypothetical protein
MLISVGGRRSPVNSSTKVIENPKALPSVS